MTVKPKTNGSEQNIRLSFLPIFSTIQPPSRPPTAAPTVTMDWKPNNSLHFVTVFAFCLINDKCQRCLNMSCSVSAPYPKPGRLDLVQPQPRVRNLGELGDGRRAVTQHEPEAHGTQNRCKRSQVQLLVLHFAVERKRNRNWDVKVKKGPRQHKPHLNFNSVKELCPLGSVYKTFRGINYGVYLSLTIKNIKFN